MNQKDLEVEVDKVDVDNVEDDGWDDDDDSEENEIESWDEEGENGADDGINAMINYYIAINKIFFS